ncbi:hypothetical protein WJX81_006901 [Elliptochloris bilobata]|uniref:USP domain-containing protein n=1 Tax=Elliptochloris bilobata TaxID=381761 RepID=A0AAW1RAD0_9CHLO
MVDGLRARGWEERLQELLQRPASHWHDPAEDVLPTDKRQALCDKVPGDTAEVRIAGKLKQLRKLVDASRLRLEGAEAPPAEAPGCAGLPPAYKAWSSLAGRAAMLLLAPDTQERLDKQRGVAQDCIRQILAAVEAGLPPEDAAKAGDKVLLEWKAKEDTRSVRDKLDELLKENKNLRMIDLGAERKRESAKEAQQTRALDLMEHDRLVQPRGKQGKAGKPRKEEQPRKDLVAIARTKAAQVMEFLEARASAPGGVPAARQLAQLTALKVQELQEFIAASPHLGSVSEAQIALERMLVDGQPYSFLDPNSEPDLTFYLAGTVLKEPLHKLFKESRKRFNLRERRRPLALEGPGAEDIMSSLEDETWLHSSEEEDAFVTRCTEVQDGKHSLWQGELPEGLHESAQRDEARRMLAKARGVTLRLPPQNSPESLTQLGGGGKSELMREDALEDFTHSFALLSVEADALADEAERNYGKPNHVVSLSGTRLAYMLPCGKDKPVIHRREGASVQMAYNALHPPGTEERAAMELRGRLLLQLQRLDFRHIATEHLIARGSLSEEEAQDAGKLRNALWNDMLTLRGKLSVAGTTQQLQQVEQEFECTAASLAGQQLGRYRFFGGLTCLRAEAATPLEPPRGIEAIRAFVAFNRAEAKAEAADKLRNEACPCYRCLMTKAKQAAAGKAGADGDSPRGHAQPGSTDLAMSELIKALPPDLDEPLEAAQGTEAAEAPQKARGRCGEPAAAQRADEHDAARGSAHAAQAAARDPDACEPDQAPASEAGGARTREAGASQGPTGEQSGGSVRWLSGPSPLECFAAHRGQEETSDAALAGSQQELEEQACINDIFDALYMLNITAQLTTALVRAITIFLVQRVGKEDGLTLYSCVWEDVLLLGLEDLQCLRRFVLEHLAMCQPPLHTESQLFVEMILVNQTWHYLNMANVVMPAHADAEGAAPVVLADGTPPAKPEGLAAAAPVQKQAAPPSAKALAEEAELAQKLAKDVVDELLGLPLQADPENPCIPVPIGLEVHAAYDTVEGAKEMVARTGTRTAHIVVQAEEQADLKVKLSSALVAVQAKQIRLQRGFYLGELWWDELQKDQDVAGRHLSMAVDTVAEAGEVHTEVTRHLCVLQSKRLRRDQEAKHFLVQLLPRQEHDIKRHRAELKKKIMEKQGKSAKETKAREDMATECKRLKVMLAQIQEVHAASVAALEAIERQIKATNLELASGSYVDSGGPLERLMDRVTQLAKAAHTTSVVQPHARVCMELDVRCDLENALKGLSATLAEDHKRLLRELQSCDVHLDALRHASVLTITELSCKLIAPLQPYYERFVVALARKKVEEAANAHIDVQAEAARKELMAAEASKAAADEVARERSEAEAAKKRAKKAARRKAGKAASGAGGLLAAAAEEEAGTADAREEEAADLAEGEGNAEQQPAAPTAGSVSAVEEEEDDSWGVVRRAKSGAEAGAGPSSGGAARRERGVAQRPAPTGAEWGGPWESLGAWRGGTDSASWRSTGPDDGERRGPVSPLAYRRGDSGGSEPYRTLPAPSRHAVAQPGTPPPPPSTAPWGAPAQVGAAEVDGADEFDELLGMLTGNSSAPPTPTRSDAAALASSSPQARAGEARQRALHGLAAAAPRLQNETGEYNCFLNVVVQCLWHCAAFREGFLGLGPERLQGNAVTAGLAVLFKSFADVAAARELAEPGVEQPRHVVAPTALREALAELNALLFNVGEMSDAAEVLGAIYDSLRTIPGGGELVDSVFGLHVSERVHCGACGKETHASAYMQYFYNVSATALRMQAGAANEGDSLALGKLLHSIDAQLHKSCDTDAGGCGALNEIELSLAREPPAVFTVQLAWESQQESAADITSTLIGIPHGFVDLSAVYSGLGGDQQYRLKSMVCFYGAHYHAFVWSSSRWFTFDDSEQLVEQPAGRWHDPQADCLCADTMLDKVSGDTREARVANALKKLRKILKASASVGDNPQRQLSKPLGSNAWRWLHGLPACALLQQPLQDALDKRRPLALLQLMELDRVLAAGGTRLEACAAAQAVEVSLHAEAAQQEQPRPRLPDGVRAFVRRSLLAPRSKPTGKAGKDEPAGKARKDEPAGKARKDEPAGQSAKAATDRAAKVMAYLAAAAAAAQSGRAASLTRC